ncbi:DUF2914 domain-containing protein [uncultured Thiomicrorhabdus sp.]
MPIADSDKPEHQRAFKTGYRYGLAGKTLSHMPHDIRQHGDLREYFAQGLETAQDAMAEQQVILSKPDWRYRIVWFSIMVLGGIATAAVMLQQAAEEKQQVSQVSLSQTTSTASDNALMSEQQRTDMLFHQQQLAKLASQRTPLQPLSDNSNLQLLSTTLSGQEQKLSISPTQSIDKSMISVPKYLRKLEFNAQLSLNKPQTIWLHWRYDGIVIQKQRYQLSSGEQSVQSVQQMSSARQGRWYLEFVDAQQQVFARLAFNYGTFNENH